MKKLIIFGLFAAVFNFCAIGAFADPSNQLAPVRMSYGGKFVGMATQPASQFAAVIASLSSTAIGLSQKYPATGVKCTNEIDTAITSGADIEIEGTLSCIPVSSTQVLQGVMSRWIGEDLSDAAGVDLTQNEGAVSGSNK